MLNENAEKKNSDADQDQFVITSLRYKLKNLRKFILLNHSDKQDLSLLKIEDGLFYSNKEDTSAAAGAALRALSRKIEKSLESLTQRKVEFCRLVSEVARLQRANTIAMKDYLEKIEEFTESYLALIIERGYRFFLLLRREHEDAVQLVEQLQLKFNRRIGVLEKNFNRKIEMGLKYASQEYVEKSFQEVRSIVDRQIKNFQEIEREIEERKEQLAQQLYSIKKDTIEGKESLKESIECTIERAQKELRANIGSIYIDFKNHIGQSLSKLQSNYNSLNSKLSSFSKDLERINRASEDELSKFKEELSKKSETFNLLQEEESERLEDKIKHLENRKNMVLDELSKIEEIISSEENLD